MVVIVIICGVHLLPTWTDIGQFLDAFWPQALATTIGVAIGLPTALWLERQREQRNAAADQSRSREAAALLATSLVAVMTDVAALITSVGPDSTAPQTGLDLSTWEVTRVEVLPACDVPTRVRLANLFHSLARIVELARRHVDATIGVGAAMGGSRDVRTKLAAMIHNHALKAGAEAQEMITVLRVLSGADQVKFAPSEDVVDEAVRSLNAALVLSHGRLGATQPEQSNEPANPT